MWSIRRGLATAAVRSFRLPKLVTPSPPLAACSPLLCDSRCAKNFTDTNLSPIYWQLIEDPELPELIKLYNSKKDPSTSIEVDKKSKLDDQNNSNKFKEDIIKASFPGCKKSSLYNRNNLNKSKSNIILDIDYPESKKSTAFDRKNSNKCKRDCIEQISLIKCKKNFTEDISYPGFKKSTANDQNNYKKPKLDINKETSSTEPKKSSAPEINNLNKCMTNIIEYKPKKSSASDRNNLKKSKTDIMERKCFCRCKKSLEAKEITFPWPKKSSSPDQYNSNKSKLDITKVYLPFEPGYRIPFRTTKRNIFQRTPVYSRNWDKFGFFKKNLKTPKSSHHKSKERTAFKSTRKPLEDDKTSKIISKSRRQLWKQINQGSSIDKNVRFNDTSKYSNNQKTEQDLVNANLHNTLTSADERTLRSIASSIEQSHSHIPSSVIGNIHQVSKNYYFEPIDLVKYKKDFLSSHSQNPIAIKSSWPKIWPKPLKQRQRKVKSEDPSPKASSLIKKRFKKRLSKSSPSRTQYLPTACKYHTFNVKDFKICGKDRAIGCQTEDLPIDCDLCNLCRAPSQSEESLPMKMKQRQDCEAPYGYYLWKYQTESKLASVLDSDSDSEGSEEPQRTKESASWGTMRRQLEQCLVALDLCDQLVEAQLQLCRIKTQDACCRCVHNLETGLSSDEEMSTRCLET